MRLVSENIKRTKLKEQLAARITSGEFKYGDKFPGLHQLCEEYLVSYVTVSKAMKMLVKEGYLLAKNGIGYFVCYVQPDIIPPRKVVNFITGINKEYSNWPIVEEGIKLFERANWQVKLIIIPEGDLSSCVSEINSPEAFSLLFFTKLNWDNFAATFKHVSQRVLVIGHLSGNPNITSIISDEYETIRRCIEYFNNLNHSKIALIASAPKKELQMLRIAAWRTLMLNNGLSDLALNKLCLEFDDAPMVDSATVKEVYSNWVKENKGSFDAVIDPFSPELLAQACIENGLKVPEDVAIIRIAREQSIVSKYSIPTLHNNLYKHFEFAFSIIEERYNSNVKAPGAWVFCPPGEIIP
jgi:DNA-binding LacI/PurR family transcriptional regulator